MAIILLLMAFAFVALATLMAREGDWFPLVVVGVSMLALLLGLAALVTAKDPDWWKDKPKVEAKP